MLTQDQTEGGGGSHLLSHFDLNDYYYISTQHLGNNELGKNDDKEQQYITIPFHICDNITGEDYRNFFQPKGCEGIHGSAIPTVWINWARGEHNKQ